VRWADYAAHIGKLIKILVVKPEKEISLGKI
jgi:hypothetical protein